MVNNKMKLKTLESIILFALVVGFCGIGVTSLAHDAFEKEDSIVCYTENSDDIGVKEMKKHLELHGYSTSDMELLYICAQIEKMQSNEKWSEKKKITDKDINKIVDNVDNQNFESDDEDEATGSILGTAATAYEKWNSLTDDEKKLVAEHPVKALAVNATSNRAFELTIMAFGKNGLGDKSDGYRHAIWNCLMTREVGKDFAEEFANAHESGKSEEDLKEKASDGFEESLHLEMDLHNNEVGRNTIDENEPIETYDDSYIYYRIMEKMTNNKVEGEIYWLHD